MKLTREAGVLEDRLHREDVGVPGAAVGAVEDGGRGRAEDWEG